MLIASAPSVPTSTSAFAAIVTLLNDRLTAPALLSAPPTATDPAAATPAMRDALSARTDRSPNWLTDVFCSVAFDAFGAAISITVSAAPKPFDEPNDNAPAPAPIVSPS